MEKMFGWPCKENCSLRHAYNMQRRRTSINTVALLEKWRARRSCLHGMAKFAMLLDVLNKATKLPNNSHHSNLVLLAET
jgi:hypothetical protein